MAKVGVWEASALSSGGVSMPMALTAIAVCFAKHVSAHCGGLNAEGCHHDRQRGGYHCHRGGGSSSHSDAVSTIAKLQIRANVRAFVKCCGFLCISIASPFANGHQLDTASSVEIPDTPISFALVPHALNDDEIKVFGGKRPKRGDWRSIAVSRSTNPGSDATCTATFIGKNVVLTAAHCVVRRGNRHASPMKIGPLTFTCVVDSVYLRAPLASVRHAADYALCTAVPYDGPLPSDFKLVRLDSLDLRPVARNDLLLVAGFGCATWNFNPFTNQLTEGPLEKELVVGDFKVASVGEDSFSSESDGRTVSALCAGDSGGPAFHGVDSKNPDGARTIRGIASMNDPLDGKVVSSFASLSTPRFRNFLECWQGANPRQLIRVETPEGSPLKPQTC